MDKYKVMNITTNYNLFLQANSNDSLEDKGSDNLATACTSNDHHWSDEGGSPEKMQTKQACMDRQIAKKMKEISAPQQREDSREMREAYRGSTR